MRKVIIITATLFLFSSCAYVFLPKRQKVTFITHNKDAVIYLEKEEIGKGEIITQKVLKQGKTNQLVIKTQGYKDNYYALPPSRRQTGYWFLQILNPLALLYVGFSLDAIAPSNKGYQKQLTMPVEGKLVYRDPQKKFIDITNIKLDIKNKNKDIKKLYVPYSTEHLMDNIKEEERAAKAEEIRDEIKANKKKNKNKKFAEDDDKEIKYDDTKFSYNIYKTLRSTGFVDTINNFFVDINNSVYLEGSINKIYIYSIYSRWDNYLKSKIFLTWYVKNNFNEIIDSISTSELSGDFTYDTYALYESAIIKSYGDAIDISYLKLHQNPNFTKYIQTETDFKNKDPELVLEKPKEPITDKSDAVIASVIIKSADKHGSGFAITNDGYILTNYHVIAGKINNAISNFTVITSSGDEIPGKVIRYNKFRDIALIKVDKQFEKAFVVSDVKSFRNLQDIFTIGAPKSIELGQSVSSGIISNERKINNINLLQLSISINGGNSCGPLFDTNGNLHGIIVSKATGKNTEGIGFAIPAYHVQNYLNIKFK